jgi:2,3-bisphosphoglycerate-independent phosphoglycerate mutase
LLIHQLLADILTYLKESYDSGVFDEFIIPSSFDGYDGLKENDGIIFCNFRSDRMREMSSVFANKDFSEFDYF